jgi:hypothetical protein
MRCVTAGGATCTLIVITANKKQADTQRYVITVIGIPFLTASKVILFYVGISALEKEVRFIFEFRVFSDMPKHLK